MSHVIVAVRADGEDQPALRWAASYAAASGGRLLAVTAWEPDQAELPPDRFDEMEALVRRHLAHEVREAESAPGRDVGFELHEGVGSPGDVLREAMERLGDDAELLVIGHPHGLAPRVTSDILRLANDGPLPVVIAQGPVSDVGAGPIVAGIDGSQDDIAVLGWAADLARRAGTTVHAALAVPLGEESYPHPPEGTSGARRTAQVEDEIALAGELDDRIPSDLELTVIEGDPDEALLALAETLGSHLVVLGRGRGPLLDKVPGRLIDEGSRNVAVVPASLPPAWHHEHGDGRLPGEAGGTTSRWKAIVGWAEEALGWATADRRFEAKGRLDRLAATDPEAGGGDLDEAEQERLLDDAELQVRRDHRDLAPDADPDPDAGGVGRVPPESG